MHKRMCFLLISCYASFTLAQSTTQQAHDLGTNLANQHLNEVGTSQISEENAQKLPHYKPNPNQQSQYDGGMGDLFNIGMSRITESSSYSSGNCDKEGFDPEAAAREGMSPGEWEGLSPVQRQRAISNQVTYFDQECEGINFLRGDYQRRERTEIPSSDNLHDWVPPSHLPDPENTSCSIDDISIDPEYQSEFCYESNTVEKRFCEEDLAVTCEPLLTGASCASAGLVGLSVSSNDTTVRVSDIGGRSHLIFGNSGTHSLSYAPGDTSVGAWSQHKRRVNFTIHDLSNVNHFIFRTASYDDFFKFSINGSSFGGWVRNGISVRNLALHQDLNSEEFIDRVGGVMITEHDGSTTKYIGDPGRVWWANGLDIDLRPYLRNGINTFEFDVFIIDGGSIYAEFDVDLYCPPECEYTWLDNCAPFENARVD